MEEPFPGNLIYVYMGTDVGLSLSYYIRETILSTTYIPTHYGNFIYSSLTATPSRVCLKWMEEVLHHIGIMILQFLADNIYLVVAISRKNLL